MRSESDRDQRVRERAGGADPHAASADHRAFSNFLNRDDHPAHSHARSAYNHNRAADCDVQPDNGTRNFQGR
jgi:hypothetical protein